MSSSNLNEKINPFEVALTQLEEASKILKLDKGMLQILSNPKRILTVSIPTKMDDGSIGYLLDLDLNIMMQEDRVKEE